MEFQRTIKKEVRVKGIGLHSGEDTEVVLSPAPENTGIIFIKDNIKIPALVNYVIDTKRGVALGKDNIKILTVEHLLSSLYSLRIANLFIHVKGEEVPIFDGSSLPWINILKDVGIVEQDFPLEVYSIEKPVLEREGKGMILLFPSQSFSITCVISFPNTILSWQKYIFKNLDNYEEEIAPARTFGFWYEIEELGKKGLIKGASLQNALLIGPNGYVNRERFMNEPVRHKVLDILGDFCILGGYLKASIYAISSGHTLHVKIIKKLWKEGILRRN
ncbi:MAG: UDP-3-O-acyl-N-acetylglucosamine deacetylase [Dictyoglomaceae bacterium]